MISVYVQKTLAAAKSDTPLTSGSVGTVVQFYFSSDWEGLNRTAVFETSAYQKETAELSADNSAVIPESVMVQDGVTLFIGVYGTNEGGSIVVPTVYANCGEIKTGANTEPGGEPVTPSQAQQLQNQIDDLDNRVDALEAGGGGLTVAQVNALDGMFKIAAYTADATDAYTAFKTAFGISDSGGGEEEPDEPVTPEVTLTSISATYSGGDVAVGTAVSELTGVVVTAHYSDGTSETVTGYTLSGTIAEGSNTITVSYGGKTTTFTVNGVAESSGEETGVSNETTWTNGVAYTIETIKNEYPDRTTGVISAYDGWERSPYLYCAGASTLRGVVKIKNASLTGTQDNAFYDADKNYIPPVDGVGTFNFRSLANTEVGTYLDVPIPENAVYFIVSAGANLISGDGFESPVIEYIPYA